MKRRTIGLFLAMLAAFSLVGCGNDAKEANSDGVENAGDAAEEAEQIDVKKVAVFLSGSETEETLEKQEAFIAQLEEKGHEVSVSLANGDAAVQQEQIESQLEQETDLFVIEPVDAYGLTEVLGKAGELEIPVIAYDDLIMDSEDVSYYTTYSYREMGHLTGEAIKKAKNLEDAAKNQISYNIEFMMGSQDSLEALFFYNGVMEILQEYFDAGVLVSPSGRNSFDSNGILRWDGEQARIRCEEILETAYQDGKTLDIVCTGFDSAAVSVAGLLEESGYVPGSENWPLITGLGCEAASVEAIETGKQYCSIYMDENILIETCVKMADTCIKGEVPEVNDSVQYDNGVKIVEANVCEAKLITAENLDELSGSAEGTEAESGSVSEVSEEFSGEESMDAELDSISVEDF